MLSLQFQFRIGFLHGVQRQRVQPAVKAGKAVRIMQKTQGLFGSGGALDQEGIGMLTDFFVQEAIYKACLELATEILLRLLLVVIPLDNTLGSHVARFHRTADAEAPEHIL